MVLPRLNSLGTSGLSTTAMLHLLSDRKWNQKEISCELQKIIISMFKKTTSTSVKQYRLQHSDPLALRHRGQRRHIGKKKLIQTKDQSFTLTNSYNACDNTQASLVLPSTTLLLPLQSWLFMSGTRNKANQKSNSDHHASQHDHLVPGNLPAIKSVMHSRSSPKSVARTS